MLAHTDKTAPSSVFQYPPNAYDAPAAKLTPSVNRLTIFGVIGNLMSWRLMGIEILRFIRANTPSVGLTSQRLSFCSATMRSCGIEIRCHESSSTSLKSRNDGLFEMAFRIIQRCRSDTVTKLGSDSAPSSSANL